MGKLKAELQLELDAVSKELAKAQAENARLETEVGELEDDLGKTLAVLDDDNDGSTEAERIAKTLFEDLSATDTSSMGLVGKAVLDAKIVLLKALFGF